MKFTEDYGDLFSLPSEFYLCHCISADFALGKGIAVEFDRRYGMKKKLLNQYPQNGKYPAVYFIDRVFNLVTKEKYWYKPTYTDLEKCLKELKELVVQNNIKYLGMPIIGCGLDRLDWVVVRKMIMDIFSDVDIYIKVVKKK